VETKTPIYFVGR